MRPCVGCRLGRWPARGAEQHDRWGVCRSFQDGPAAAVGHSGSANDGANTTIAIQSVFVYFDVVGLEGPDWLAPWCEEHLGSADRVLFTSSQLSAVFGIRLDDGREVVVKARSEPKDRIASCLQAQEHLAAAGFPCPRPVTPPSAVGDLTVHAETLLAGGDLLRGTSDDVARKCAQGFAWLMTLLEPLQIRPPLPNPYWLRWEHLERGIWPDVPWLAGGDSTGLPDFIIDTATRTGRRLHSASLPYVLGHGDFEAQNLRWKDCELWAVHDWDSLAWLPEAALVGAASGVFTSSEAPILAPLESSEAFLNAYQDRRGRRFTREEEEVAWAASLVAAVHDAREEALLRRPPVTTLPLSQQAEERLRRADA
jgi:Ser/Thr protein kinase RdoA (MazF antagonist)